MDRSLRAAAVSIAFAKELRRLGSTKWQGDWILDFHALSGTRNYGATHAVESGTSVRLREVCPLSTSFSHSHSFSQTRRWIKGRPLKERHMSLFRGRNSFRLRVPPNIRWTPMRSALQYFLRRCSAREEATETPYRSPKITIHARMLQYERTQMARKLGRRERRRFARSA